MPPKTPKTPHPKFRKFLRHWGWPLLSALLFCLLLSSPSWAQSLTLNLGAAGGKAGTGTGTVANQIIQLIAITTILSLAPSILMMVTSFTRIVVVLSLLRTALGLQQTPPNTVIISLALFLTLLIMQPTIDAAWQAGVQPVIDNKMEAMQGFKLASEPFAKFMIAHTFEDDLQLFANANSTNKASATEKTDHPPLQVLIPAFMISELKRAFEIGFLVFIPFLIIDMVVASILMSMGMMMLPPVTISIPFKIIFFVLIDGWKLISSSLIQSYVVK
jgi:flagellar biosynthetic protein FliP